MEEKHYTVSKIEGEYAYIRNTQSGEELFISMSLLPLGIDEGDRLEYDSLSFKIIK